MTRRNLRKRELLTLSTDMLMQVFRHHFGFMTTWCREDRAIETILDREFGCRR